VPSPSTNQIDGSATPVGRASVAVCFVPFGVLVALAWAYLFVSFATRTLGRGTGLASLALALAVAVGVGVASAYAKRTNRRALAAGMFGVGAAIWIEPWLSGLPDSPASGGMPCFALAVPIAAAYVMARVASDRSLEVVVSQTRATFATLAGLVVSATLAWARVGLAADPLLWSERSAYSVAEHVRVEAVLAGLAFAVVVLALAARRRRLRERVERATSATVVSPGLAHAADGRAVVVPESLVGEVTVLERTSARPTYRDGDRDRAQTILRGARAAHLRALAEDIQVLDGLALAGSMAIAAPASADLSRHVLVALVS
jgi:hypothetical protein